MLKTILLLIFFSNLSHSFWWRFIYSYDPTTKCDYKCNTTNPHPTNKTWIVTAPNGEPFCHRYSGNISVQPINTNYQVFLPFKSQRLIICSSGWGAVYYYDDNGCQKMVAIDQLDRNEYGSVNITLDWMGVIFQYFKKCYCNEYLIGPCRC